MKATIVCFKAKGQEYTGTLVSQSGKTLTVSVQDEADPEAVTEMKVQIKQIESSWFEEEVNGETVMTDITKGFPPVTTVHHQADPADAPKPARTKKEPSGLITLKAICAELDIAPRIARRKLRKEKGLVGTGGAWEFSPDDVEDIKALLGKAE